MVFDEKTRLYFDDRVKQVFVYLTNKCQLKCQQCLYKPLLDNSSDDIDFIMLCDLLKDFKKFGAYKVSFLGGEPTLYYDKSTQKDFGDVIQYVKEIGYEYIRVDTNGQFDSEFLEDKRIKKLNEITFSLDGHNESTNDIVRGTGSYKKCVKNISRAVKLGYNVQITSCVHKYSCPNINTGYENLEKMIFLAQKLDINSINLHPIIKVGMARDNWIENTNINPSVWIQVYKKIAKNVNDQKYSINVRIPMRFVEKSELVSNIDKYTYCPVQMGERALIMPDEQIKVCAFTIGTSNCIANYNNENVTYNKIDNELEIKNSESIAVCKNQNSYGDLLPLCMSYKPNQKEVVWNNSHLAGR